MSISTNLNGSSVQTYSNSPNTEDKLHQLQSEYDDLKMELTRVSGLIREREIHFSFINIIGFVLRHVNEKKLLMNIIHVYLPQLINY